jgi:hypothetical protein
MRFIPLSLPGLTRQSTLAPTPALRVGAWVKPGHDSWKRKRLDRCGFELRAISPIAPRLRVATAGDATAPAGVLQPPGFAIGGPGGMMRLRTPVSR